MRTVAAELILLLNRLARSQPSGPTEVIGGRRLGGASDGAT